MSPATSVYLRVAGRTDRGRVRSNNEDGFVAVDLTSGESSTLPRWSGRFGVGPSGALVAVSDGMGGEQAGEVASALVLSSLAQGMAGVRPPVPSHQQIAVAVHEANRSVWAEACARGIQMGATLTALLVRGTAAYIAEIGDSRAYLLRDGAMTQLTKDQSYVQMLVDRGTVTPEEAQVMPFRNVILQAMGHGGKLQVALGRLELRRKDCLLLCSDGLTNEVSDREIRDVVLTAPDLTVAADLLVDLANSRGGRDNETVVLAGVGGDLPPPSTREPLEKTYRILETFDVK